MEGRVAAVLPARTEAEVSVLGTTDGGFALETQWA